MEPTRTGDRCVLWRPRGAPVPASLAGALSKRGLAYTEVEDPYSALAEACVRARSGQGCVLLLVEPGSLPRVDAVLEAIETHVAGVRCWSYKRGGSPELGPIVREKPKEPVQAAPVEVRSGLVRPGTARSAPARTGPVLRLTGDNFVPGNPDPGVGEVRIAGAGASADDGDAGASEPDRGTNLLTEEELAMLLGERPPRAMG